MRIAPVGLVADDPFRTGCDFAAITHGHPTGWLAAGGMAVVIARLLGGADLEVALDAAEARLRAEPEADETLEALGAARRRAAADLQVGSANPKAVESLGQGWIAEEAFAISVYCALVALDFENGVLLAVNQGGDSDSTGVDNREPPRHPPWCWRDSGPVARGARGTPHQVAADGAGRFERVEGPLMSSRMLWNRVTSGHRVGRTPMATSEEWYLRWRVCDDGMVELDGHLDQRTGEVVQRALAAACAELDRRHGPVPGGWNAATPEAARRRADGFALIIDRAMEVGFDSEFVAQFLAERDARRREEARDDAGRPSKRCDKRVDA